MIGRINVAFGFLYLVLTAALGPYMVQQFDGVRDAMGEKQAAVGKLQLVADSGFENQETLEPMTGEEIAKLTAKSLLAINKQINAEAPIDSIKGGPHAHGNLEALLNIAVGVVLCFLAVPVWLKWTLSGMFIIGTLMHSGLLYLRFLEMPWAGKLLGTGIGPVLILAGLALAGVCAAIGFKGQIVSDR